MRPVMLGTAEYELAKCLDCYIKPNINVTYSVYSTGAFMNNPQNFHFSGSHNLVSFDVSYLFTDVALDETVGLITECVYSDSSKRVPPFPKTVFIKFLQFATSGSGMFMYKNKLYKLYVRYVDDVFAVFDSKMPFNNFFRTFK